VIVRGHVQGVFFRDSTRRLAAERAVSGWARNRPDGSVEAVFEGAPAEVAFLVRFCREGPSGAKVESVDTFAEELEGLQGFSVT
jgi:acylphosphatase